MALKGGGSLSGTFSGTGASDHLSLRGGAVILLNFGSGTVDVQASLDGTNFYTLTLPDGVTAASWTADVMMSLQFPVPMFARFNCTSYTSGIEYTMVAGDAGPRA